MNSTIHVTEVDATTTVIVLAGDQDMPTCSDFLEYATAVLDRCDRLFVDLSAVSFIDSMMLSTLRRLSGFAKLREVAFETIVGQNRNVRAIVETPNLGFQLNCQDSLADVLLASAVDAKRPRSPEPRVNPPKLVPRRLGV
jgi:anti-anti-sigma regulatory factor